MKHHQLLQPNSNMLLSWDEIFHMLAQYYQMKTLSRATSKEISPYEKQDVNINVDGTFVGSNLQDHFPERVKPLLKLFPDTKHVSLYFSFLPGIESHGIHCDVTDVYIWQQQGITQWIIYDNGKHTYNLMPGDILYIPKGMYHNTIPITARAGLSFGNFPPDWDMNKETPAEYLKRNATSI
jgi:ribosomal protein L16 Arg81 hydroxylase